MSIEKSPSPAAAPKAAARPDPHGAKAKAAAGDGAAAAPGAGFLAILGALDEAPGEVVALTSSDAAVPEPVVPVPLAAFDASLLLQQNPQIAAAQALQKAAAAAKGTAAVGAAAAGGAGGATSPAALGAATGATTAAGSAAATAAQLALDAAAQPLASAPGVAVPASAAAETPAGLPAALPARAAASDGAAGRGAAAQALAVPVAAPELAPSFTQGLQHAAARARLARDAQQDTGTGAAASAGAATGSERVDSSRLLAAQEQARTPLAERALEPLFVPLLAKPEKTQGERTGLRFQTAEPTYSGTTLGISAPDFSQSGAPAPVMAPEMQVAEQVSYWVSQNVQNAELTLDGLGQLPVEVSISVQGNEAHIVFRSDEAATRSILESAGTHLKEMLQSEGLQLGGVSVGNSGSGEAGGGERRARQNARQGVIAPLQVASPDSGPRLRTDAGRAVDLFV